MHSKVGVKPLVAQVHIKCLYLRFFLSFTEGESTLLYKQFKDCYVFEI